MLNFQKNQNSIIIFLTETKYVIGVIKISMLVEKLFIEICYIQAVGVRGIFSVECTEDRYHIIIIIYFMIRVKCIKN